MKSNIAQINPEIKFSHTGYPLDPTGRMYTRAEIVADSSIPLPLHVDAANPPPYWQRKTGSELEAERSRIDAKNRRNAAAREKRAGEGGGRGEFVNLATTIAMPTLTLVNRVNGKQATDPVETFVNGTSDPLATDPDETDGPRNLGESIMELNGQDYKAARRAAQQP